MSEHNINPFDSNFDPSNPGESHKETQAFIHYGYLCWLSGYGVEKVFESGVGITLPGITRTQYQKGMPARSTGEPVFLNLLKAKPGSPNKLLTLIARETNNEGQFDSVIRFKNYDEAITIPIKNEAGEKVKSSEGKEIYGRLVTCSRCKTEQLVTTKEPVCNKCQYTGKEFTPVIERNAFYKFQVQELEAVKVSDLTGYNKLDKTGPALFGFTKDLPFVPAKWDTDDTGFDKGNEVRQYLKNITIYNSTEEMEAAKALRTSSNGTEPKQDYGHYPVMWTDDPSTLNDYVIKANSEGKSRAEIIKTARMTGPSINGGVVDTEALLNEILEMPF